MNQIKICNKKNNQRTNKDKMKRIHAKEGMKQSRTSKGKHA